MPRAECICYLNGKIRTVVLIEPGIMLWLISRAHKRFTELLTKDEKDLPNVRVPMEKILTLPELKV